MDVVKISETIDFLEKGKFEFSEADRQLIAWYAYKTEDRELTESLAKELSVKDCDKDTIVRKYLSIVDREEPLIEQIEKLLVSVEMIRLKESATLALLEQLLMVNGLKLPAKEKMERDEELKETMPERIV